MSNPSSLGAWVDKHIWFVTALFLLLFGSILIFIFWFYFLSSQSTSVVQKNFPQSIITKRTAPITFGTSTLTLVEETVTTTPVDSEAGFNAVAPLPYNLMMKTFKQYWQTPTTTVTVSYPIMNYPGQTDLAEAFNAVVLDMVNFEAENFLRNMAALAPSDYFGDGYDIDVSAMPKFGSRDFVSIMITISAYYGGVHPDTTSYNFNFDLAHSKELRVSDLFIPKSNYLSALSKYGREILMSQWSDEDKELLDLDLVQQGTAPELENFHTVIPDDYGLTITFDAYDVDAYAGGPHEVTIPYARLKGIIAPNVLALITATPLADQILVTMPKYNDEVESPLTVRGQAPGSWFFEGTFPVRVEDANGAVLGRGNVTADADWMQTGLVSFHGTVTFDPSTTNSGFVIFAKDNPSGLPANDREIRVPCFFK